MRRNRVGGIGSLRTASFSSLAALALCGWLSGSLARAQEAAPDKDKPKAASEDVFDGADAPAKPGEGKAKADDDAGADPKVGADELLSFRQKEVAAQMNELEERMFRLSEALKALEPENSSRLMLGLKFSREQLILHQMKEAQSLLAKLALDDAVKQEQELLTKLDRLQALLLSTDLDFALQLERLRQMREIMARIQKAIREEERERDDSGGLAKKQKELDALRKKKLALEQLIAQEKSHIEGTTPLANAAQLSADDEKAAAKLGDEQKSTENDTAKLAQETDKPGEKSENLAAAQTAMAAAAESLGGAKAGDALPNEKSALDSLEKEAAATDARIQKAEQAVAQANFDRIKSDQMGNRSATEGIGELTRKLGDSGANTLASLTKAGGSMSKAEGSLSQGSGESAESDQEQAVQDLKDAYDQLREEQEKLLEQVRAEVKKRVLEGLTTMLERQIAIRESTVTLAPKVRDGSRNAIKALGSLGTAEGDIAQIADDLITLTEETEFGIALPAALQVVRDQMVDVQGALTGGDASDKVVNAEKQIESDLQDLLDAMKRMPTKGKPPKGKPQKGQRDRERELNRLLAELKMIRLMQLRVNRETLTVDRTRQDALEAATAKIEREIEGVADRQVHVRDATEKLAEDRGDELQ